jgi:DNA-binding NarL/FixJ family response regulator
VIGVLVVDDHPVVRSGVCGMLAGEDDITVVGQAGSGAEAVTATLALRPDLVLMDLRMPGGDGASATAAIVALGFGTRVMVLTTHDSDSDILRAVEAGASGYLLKDSSRAELLAAIRATARGETVLAPSVAGKLWQQRHRPTVMLSPREAEVLRLVAQGLSNAAIGAALHVSEATVKTHLLRAFAKLDVSDRTAAVTTAMAQGLI